MKSLGSGRQWRARTPVTVAPSVDIYRVCPGAPGARAHVGIGSTRLAEWQHVVSTDPAHAGQLAGSVGSEAVGAGLVHRDLKRG